MINHKGREKAGENNDHNPVHLSVPELLIQVTLYRDMQGTLALITALAVQVQGRMTAELDLALFTATVRTLLNPLLSKTT